MMAWMLFAVEGVGCEEEEEEEEGVEADLLRTDMREKWREGEIGWQTFFASHSVTSLASLLPSLLLTHSVVAYRRGPPSRGRRRRGGEREKMCACVV